MSDDYTLSAQYAAALHAFTAQIATLASEVAMMTQAVYQDRDPQTYEDARPHEPAPILMHRARLRLPASYTPKNSVVTAVQWHGWERGPHDLGIHHPPAYSCYGSAHGWLATGVTRTSGVPVAPGDWLVLTRDGELITVLAPHLFEATYVRVESYGQD